MSSECPFCGRFPLADDPQAREALVREIREQSRERMHGAEAAWATLVPMHRQMIVEWLRGIANRPPVKGDPHFEPLWLFLTSLAADLNYQVEDDLVPVDG